MKNINLFTVSEAGQQFSKLLELVSAGEEVVIVDRRTKQRFRVTQFEQKPLNDNVSKHP